MIDLHTHRAKTREALAVVMTILRTLLRPHIWMDSRSWLLQEGWSTEMPANHHDDSLPLYLNDMTHLDYDPRLV